MTAALVEQLVPIERIFVVAPGKFVDIIREQLPSLPHDNLLVEPAQRDTGPACAFAMAQVLARDPEAQVAMLWSDHHVTKPEAFVEVLRNGFTLLEKNPNQFVCVGVKPTAPETGYGYIQMGKERELIGNQSVYRVKRFVEKPDLATAKAFVSSWEYLWNPGYNLCGARHFMNTLYKVAPELKEQLEKLGSSDLAALKETYEALPKQSIDVLLIQQLPEQYVLPADLGWSDVGSWSSIHDVLSADIPDGMVTRGPVHALSSKNSLVYAKDRPIMLVGMEDVVVVDEGDAVLIMRKSASQQVKTLVEELKQSNPELL